MKAKTEIIVTHCENSKCDKGLTSSQAYAPVDKDGWLVLTVSMYFCNEECFANEYGDSNGIRMVSEGK